jgi:hypothetical protein
MTPSSAVEIVPLLVAVVIVMGGVFTAIAFGVRSLNRRVARADQEVAVSAAAAPGGDPYRSWGARPPASGVELAPLYYVLSILCWPVGFIAGAFLLRDARTARVGRVCMMIGMGIIGVVTALTCAGMVAGALMLGYEPEPYDEPFADAWPEEDDRYGLVPPVADQPLAVGKVGEDLRIDDLVVRVHAIDGSLEASSPPGAGRRRIAVDVSFRNEGAAVTMVGAHQLTIFETEGYVAQPASFADGRTPRLAYASVPPGRLARGWVTFELESSATVERLQITSANGFGVAEIRFGD